MPSSPQSLLPQEEVDLPQLDKRADYLSPEVRTGFQIRLGVGTGTKDGAFPASGAPGNILHVLDQGTSCGIRGW